MAMTMNVGLVQLNSINDTAFNLKSVLGFIQQALQLPIETRPELLVFPENSLFFRLGEAEEIKPVSLGSFEIKTLENEAQRTNLCLHLTTPVLDQGHVWNASILIRPNEKAEIIYKKIHLFDITLKDQKPIRESDHFKSGEQVTSFEVNGFKIGSSICYDIRFSELYYQHAKNKVDAILVPSAFLVKTGQAHWETLMRARAIESQCYILAPAQSGVHQSPTSEQKRETYGHSLIIGPWGDVQSCLPTGTGLICNKLDHETVQAVRRQIPMELHRRL